MADNIITVSGNLTREPELRFTASGKAVAGFGLAVNRRFQQNGEWVDAPPQFFNVTAWDRLGEHCAQTFGKGDRAVVTGRLEVREYDGQDGNKRQSIDIIADDVSVSLKYATATIQRMAKADSTADAPAGTGTPRPASTPSPGRAANPVYNETEEPF